MSYGKDLLTAAVEKAGSRYALAKITAIDEGRLSRAWHGERAVPASWVFPLAQAAGVDPGEALEHFHAEQAEKKRALRRSGGGVAATLLLFALSAAMLSGLPGPASAKGLTAEAGRFDLVHIVSRLLSTIVGWLRAVPAAPMGLHGVGTAPPRPPGLRPLRAVRHAGPGYLSPVRKGPISGLALRSLPA